MTTQAVGGSIRQVPNFNGSSLSAPVRLTTAEAAVLTAPASGRYKITSIVLCESSGNATTVTLRKYASTLGNVATADLFHALALAANETVILDLGGFYLTNGQILAGLASANSRINIDVNYEVEK